MRRSHSLLRPTGRRAEEKVLERDGRTSGLHSQDGRLLSPHLLKVPMPSPPPCFSSCWFYRVDGHPSHTLLWFILNPMHFFLPLTCPPPCPPFVPTAGRAWPGLRPAQKLRAGASVMVSIKTKLLCALTKKIYWKTKVRKSPALPLSSSK